MERLTKISAVGEHLPQKPLNLIHKSDSSESNLTEIIEKLGNYEDAEEQGLLMRLPCKVGDTVYFAHHDRVISSEVLSVKYHAEAENYGVFIRERLTVDVEGILAEINFCDIGKTVFLTREEAEAKLKEMRENNEK